MGRPADLLLAVLALRLPLEKALRSWRLTADTCWAVLAAACGAWAWACEEGERHVART